MAVTRKQYKGAAAQTTITNALGTGDTSITIAATTGWPSAAGVPFFVVISPGTASEEKCLATISGSTLTLTRAQDDTTAQSHSSGATIYPVFSADDADEANKLASTLTTRGDLLTMDSGPDFKRLAVGSADTVLKSDGSDVSWGSIVDANITAATVTGAKLANATVETKTGDYTLVAGDRNKRIVANKSSAIAFTVDDSVHSAGDAIWVHNINTGTLTLTAGSGVTLNTAGALTFAQWEGGVIYFTSSASAIVFRGGGVVVPTSVEYLVIAGGGGGGDGTAAFSGGGGGAGGYRNSVSGEDSGGGAAAETPMSVTSGVTYTITVGGGGASNTSGSNSSIAGTGLTTITSTGGGLGKGTNTSANGGSGGGGHTTSTTGGTGTANQGFAGGDFVSGTNRSAGGGGSDAVGAPNDTTANGGAGNSSSITGSPVSRAGGGGGGAFSLTPGSGGAGGGGAGSNTNVVATAGGVNTGGGGGGTGATNPSVAGGAGGKGVVILRQPLARKFPTTLTGGTWSSTATHWVFTFNDSGTIGWS